MAGTVIPSFCFFYLKKNSQADLNEVSLANQYIIKCYIIS